MAAVDRPSAEGTDPDIRFLALEELEAVIRAVPDDLLGHTERGLYLTTAMSGLRQGELVGLRWRDIDWAAGKDQGPAQALSRGVQQAEVPAWQPLRPTGRPGRAGAGAALQRSAYRTDDDLVFPHPETGNPYDTSKLRARYDAAVGAAGVRDDVRFHHLRHTFGTRMAAAGVPLRTLREWRGASRLQDDADLRPTTCRMIAARPSSSSAPSSRRGQFRGQN